MSDLIQAFNSNEVLALTGVSLRRLQYWDETDFIRPSIAARRGRGSPRLYGFRDLIALRIAARLRDQLSLPALRKLKEALDVDAPFASVRFALLPGGDVVYLGPTGQLEAARRPGQITMSFDIPLEEIRADLHAGVDALRERSGVGGIERRRGVLAGKPALAGTRITPAAVRRMVADGWSVKRILEESPDIRAEDIEVAMAQAG